MGYGSGLGNDPIPAQSSIYPETHDTTYPQPLVIRGWCSAAPTDTTANVYAPGCVLIYTGASANSPTEYVNTGTAAAPVWTARGLNTTAKGLSTVYSAHAIYSFAVDGGAISTITPASTAQIPNNAIIVGSTFNSTTAFTGGGSLSVGVSAGLTPPTSKLLGIQNTLATFTTDALVNGALTFAAPAKMTAAGNITVTITNATITAGILECFVYYVVALNA